MIKRNLFSENYGADSKFCPTLLAGRELQSMAWCPRLTDSWQSHSMVQEFRQVFGEDTSDIFGNRSMSGDTIHGKSHILLLLSVVLVVSPPEAKFKSKTSIVIVIFDVSH